MIEDFLSLKNKDGYTQLHIAVVNYECGQNIFNAIATPFKELTQEQRRSVINIADNKGNTAIHHAATNNATAVLQFLIDQGANLEAVDKYGWTALHTAAAHNQEKAAEILLKAAQKKAKVL